MNTHRKYLFTICILLFSGLFSSHAQSVVLYSDNFELGLGNWTNVSTGDNRDWTRDSAGTPSVGTGPSTGAASTYYVYLETSSGYAYNAGDTAILQGPNITGTGIHLAFQYHMYGANIGTLSVDVLSGGIWINDVWSISGQQHTSNTATYTSVDIDLSGYSVSRVRFRATAAGGYTGDMAIDNVQITSIPTGPTAPVFNSDPISKSDAKQNQVYNDSIAADATDANGDTLTFSKISGPAWLNVASDGQLSGTPQASDVGANTFVVEVSDGSLTDSATLNITVNDNTVPTVLFSDNFESGMGNWANVTVGDNNNWSRDSGGTPSAGTGPLSGADGSAYYMYLETSSGAAYYAGDSAILQGPSLIDSNIHLAFKYHMYGANTGTLAVDVLSGGVWINDVWSISGQQHTSNAAAYTAVDLDLSDYDVAQIRFRATAVGGYMGDIAIDSVEITSHFNNDQDADGVLDSVDQCPNTPADEIADSNGCSPSQIDSDNDGVADINDAFPSDPNEWLDTDGDGIGNNADTDDDADGVLDVNDAFPLDANETLDTDGDGIGNNADTDDDNDGVLDVNDAYPLISLGALTDTDGDGIPNDCDAACVALGMAADDDDDNDGFNDIVDAFPLDPNESLDTDGDGIGNNSDQDDDGDGLTDVDEVGIYNTDPLVADTDTDGMPDGWEVQHRLLPTVNDAAGDLDGDGITNLDEYNFGTDPSPPIINSTVPVHQAIDVLVDSAISVTFSEAIEPTSVSTFSFIVNDGLNDIAGTLTTNGDTVTFTPNQVLASNILYTVIATQGITDLSSNALSAEYQWTFTTQSSYNLSGNITSSAIGLDAVTLTLSGDASGTVTSDSLGQFQFQDITAGNYTITPSLLGYVFTPASIDIQLTDSNVSGIDFEANTIPVINVPADYSSIQQAIDNAIEGGTISVSDGVYTENVIINKAITLESVNGYSSTEILAADSNLHVISVNAANVTIKGFDISNALGYYRAAINFAPGSHNGKALDNRCGYDDLHRNYIGISVYSSDNMEINNNICNHWGPFGVYVDTSNGSSITNNTSTDHGFEGISLVTCNSCTISGNTVTRTRTGIKLTYSDNTTIDNNDSSTNNQHGIHVLNAGINSVINNTASSNTEVGVYIESSGTTTVNGNTSNSNGISGTVIYNSASSVVSQNTSNSNSLYGIFINSSNSCRVEGNSTLANSNAGIRINYADSNEIIGNYSSSNTKYGIEVDFSTGNVITENIARTKVTGLTAYGIYFRGGANNTVYLNQFENNSSGASVISDNGAVNIWVSPVEKTYIYNGTTFTGFIGNYYNDHVLVDSDNDGITDTDMVLPGVEPSGTFPMVAPLSSYHLQ